MENNSDSSADKFAIYSDCLKSTFEKMKKNITKKHAFYNEISQMCKEIPESLAHDKGKPLNADKYFIYFKMALEGDNIKLIESLLEAMQKLVKEDLMLGQSADLEGVKTSNREHHYGPGQLKRKLVDSMVDTIVNLFNLSDENIWLHSVKLFYTMYRNPNTRIHNESLLKIFKICVRIFLSSRTNVNCDTAKSSLNHMITYLFNQMETSNAVIFSRETLLSDEKESLGYLTHSNSISNRSMSVLNRSDFASSRMSVAGGVMHSLGSINSNGSGGNYVHSSSVGVVYRNPLDEMLGKVLRTMVDDVCLYLAKKQTDPFESNHDQTTNDFNSNKISDIPLRCVPFTSPNIIELQDNNISSSQLRLSTPPSAYTKLTNPMIENERGNISGNFGWCLMCRAAANFYCKDSRYPVCSYECKQKIQQEDAKIVNQLNGELTSEDDLALLFYLDSVAIFKSLCKLVSTSVSTKNEAFNSRAKVISLELILSILEKPGSAFLTGRDFIKVVKEDLMEGLLRNCVSDEVSLFSLSLSVFFKIWHHFREHLKAQISVFIETVFLKILDSGNSSFNHKWVVLDNFYKLAGTPKFFVELYVNYDSDISEKDLTNRIVFSLSKISQGKYNRSDNITPQQEYLLRTRALDILTMVTRTILMFTQDQVGWTAPRLNGFEDGREEQNNLTTIINITTAGEDFDDVSVMDSTQSEGAMLKEKLDLNRKMKHDISNAVDKFNIKIKSGILYLKKLGLVSRTDKEQEAIDIAGFLKNSHGLKKEHIGDYLGDNSEVALKVLSHYVDSFDFQKVGIVDSIREFLSLFQLPGEGQKIDRIMEKFAAKFYKDNPGVYETADCAYYVAFSIIMLQTSIHNPNVKKKMTLEEFSKMLKGMNGGKDLDPSYISDIYSQIQNKSITLKEHEEAKDKIEGKKKTELFKKETERMYQEGTERLKKGVDKLYLKVCEIEHIAPLMDSIWTALLAMYSLILEDSDDNTLDSLCIEGISNCIKLCGMLNLDLQKEALIKGFCKMTNLHQGKEIKDKHILCIRSILSLANVDGRFLKGCWKNVLELLSKIDYYHMVVSGSKSEMEVFLNEIRTKKRSSMNVDKEIVTEKANMDRIAKEISQDDYEIIFNKTVLLDQQSIVDFVKSLCEISREELACRDNARIFSLQKLVEVAEFNMNRVRIVWANIWAIISEHLTEVGSNPSPVIAEKAVDSLRQLAKKFLQKDEISVYQFQKDFLKPFENILVNNINMYRTKEYVITCIANLVLAEAPSIKSGWRIIFNIFQLAAEDSQKDIIRKTFETIVKVLDNHFSQVKDNFPELAHCLKKFALNYPEEVVNLFFKVFSKIDEGDENVVLALLTSMASILTDGREHVRKIASDKLFLIVEDVLSKKVKFGNSVVNNAPNLNSTRNKEESSYQNKRKPSTGETKEGEKDVLNSNSDEKCGNNLKQINNNKSNMRDSMTNSTNKDWDSTIYKIIFKLIIDDLISNKFSSTLEEVLFKIIELFSSSVMSNIFLPDFLTELVIISSDHNESLALSGIEALKFLISRHSSFSPVEFWEGITSTIADIFNRTRQTGLLELDMGNFNLPSYQQKYQDIVYNNIVYCIVQHNMIELCEFIIDRHINEIRIEDVNLLLDCLRDSFTLAYKFNIEFNLRKLVSFHFMSDLSQIAALFKQQQDGTALYFKILNLLFESEDEIVKAVCKKKMLLISHSIMKGFIDRMDFNVDEGNNNGSNVTNGNSNSQYLITENERLMKNMVPALVDHIIPSLIRIDFGTEPEYIDDFTKIFLDLIPCSIIEVRSKVKLALGIIFEKMKEMRNKQDTNKPETQVGSNDSN